MVNRTRRKRITLKRSMKRTHKRYQNKKQAGGAAFNMPWPFKQTKTSVTKQVSSEFKQIIKFLADLNNDQLSNLLNNTNTQKEIKKLLKDSSSPTPSSASLDDSSALDEAPQEKPQEQSQEKTPDQSQDKHLYKSRY